MPNSPDPRRRGAPVEAIWTPDLSKISALDQISLFLYSHNWMQIFRTIFFSVSYMKSWKKWHHQTSDILSCICCIYITTGISIFISSSITSWIGITSGIGIFDWGNVWRSGSFAWSVLVLWWPLTSLVERIGIFIVVFEVLSYRNYKKTFLRTIFRILILRKK